MYKGANDDLTNPLSVHTACCESVLVDRERHFNLHVPQLYFASWSRSQLLRQFASPRDHLPCCFQLLPTSDLDLDKSLCVFISVP